MKRMGKRLTGMLLAICLLLGMGANLTVTADAASDPRILSEPDGLTEVPCGSPKELYVMASGGETFEWQVLADPKMGYWSLEQLISMNVLSAQNFQGYSSSVLTVNGRGLTIAETEPLTLRCKITSLSGRVAYSVAKVIVTHDWEYVSRGASGHRKTCATCDAVVSTEEHSLRWSLTSTDPRLAKKDCVYCDYTVGGIPADYVYSEKVTVTFDSNGGVNSYVAAGTTKYPVQKNKYSWENPLQSSRMSRTGYRFMGWAFSPYAKDPVYWPDQQILFAEDVTLYAVWADLYYGYGFLSDTQKMIYDQLDVSLNSAVPSSKITFSASDKITTTQLKETVEMYLSDHPDCFWFTGGYSYTLSQNYILSMTPVCELDGSGVSRTEIALARKVFDEAVIDILLEMNEEDLSEKDHMALWLHDKVAGLVSYESTDNDQSAYGALIDGKAVCAGYASLYQHLLQCVGIPAWKVVGSSVNPGTGSLESHAWTLMWLGSDCVYTDVTWDDQESQLYHLYYARPLSAFSTDHVPDAQYMADKLPACSTACSDHGYFELYRPSQNLTGNITADSIRNALSMAPTRDQWAAELFDGSGTELKQWLKNSSNLQALISGLGTGRFSIGYSSMGDQGSGQELHLTVRTDTPVPLFNIPGVSMTLGGDLAVYFWVPTAKAGAGDYLEITKTYADRADVVKTVSLSSCPISNGHYLVPFTGISAKEMNDTLYATVYNASGVAISNRYETSVKQYALNQFGKAATTDALKTVLADMLNYGAAAQTEFQYDTGNLVNSAMTAQQAAYATASLNTAALSGTSQKGTACTGMSLSLKSSIVLNVFYNSTDVPAGAVAKISFTDHRGNPKTMEIPANSFGSMSGTGFSYKYLNVDILVASDINTVVSVDLYSGGSCISQSKFNVANYCLNHTDNANVVALAKFCLSAYAYFHP